MTQSLEFEIEELAAFICGLDFNDVERSEIDQTLYEKFEADIEVFQNLVEALIPLIDIGWSPLTDSRYKGFSDQKGMWLTKIEVS